MEEKERYECKYNEKLMKHYTFDNENKEELGYKGVVRVLNQQDARIKELEKENQKANIKNYLTDYYLVEKENQQLKEQLEETKQTGSYQVMLMCQKENFLLKQQLKQSQNKKAIEVLEKVKKYFLTTDDWLVDVCELLDFVNNLIKELVKENM